MVLQSDRICLFPGRILTWLVTGLCFVALSFSTYAQYTVGGNASSLGSGCYRLTQSVANQAGYVYKTAAINLNEGFDYKFTVNLGTSNGGADGIIFVLRGSLGAPYIGAVGGSLGFSGTGFSSNSLGIEVDSYENATSGDLAADHIGILKNGTTDHTSANSLAGPIQASLSAPNIEDGQDHVFNVRWDPATQELDVYLDCQIRLQYTGNIIDSVFGGDTLVHWGFLGTTGAATNEQKFCLTSSIENYVEVLNDTAICKGDTAQLVAGTSALTYQWTPPLGLSSTTIHNPKAYPVVTDTYSVRTTYLCDTVYDTVIVSITPPNFSTSGIITNVSCKDACDGEVDLSVNGGTGVYTYQWSSGSSNQDVNSLCAGYYYVTVQDTLSTSPNHKCYVRDTLLITQPQLLVTTIVNASKNSCYGTGACDAYALASVTGGTPPFQYLWSTGETANQAYQLCPDSNWVTVTDAHGCIASDGVNILEPDSIITNGLGDTMICINQAAAIAATSLGGTPPFSYIWHENALNGPVVSVAGSDAFFPVITTTYYVESYDANGCVGDTADVLVKVRPPLGLEFESVDTICAYDTIDILAIGVGGDSTYTYTWEAGGLGPTLEVSPDVTTYYRVTVNDGCGTPFHVDSVKVQVGGYDPIRATIRFEDDSLCLGESTYLIASGRGGFHGPDEYYYTWQHSGEHDVVQFVQPSVTSTYVLRIADMCDSKPGWDTLTVYVGETHFPEVTVEPTLACAKADVQFSIDEYFSKYDYTWQIDQKDVFLEYEYDSVLYRFSEPGCYFFDLSVTTDFGCFATKRFDCAVRILEAPTADFTSVPLNPSTVDPFMTFTNISSSVTSGFFWVIDGDTFYNDSVVIREFRESSQPYTATLFVASEEGCYDSASHTFSFYEEDVVYYPSSFTPNGDGLNDVFLIEAEGIQPDGFDLSIYDRWGGQVFRSTRIEYGWDGKTPDGPYVPMGVYFFRCKYRDKNNIQRVLSGTINIGIIGERTGLK